jgi:hypothetical protein
MELAESTFLPAPIVDPFKGAGASRIYGNYGRCGRFCHYFVDTMDALLEVFESGGW